MMRLIRLTDPSWDAPRAVEWPKLPRGEMDAWWHAREREQRRQRVRDACTGEDEVSAREQAWVLWEMMVGEGK